MYRWNQRNQDKCWGGFSIVLLNKGKVIEWIAHKGFGFIAELGTNKSYFVHQQALKTPKGAFRALSVGQEVEFNVAKDGDREKAVDVTAVGGGLLPEGRRPHNQSNENQKATKRAPELHMGVKKSPDFSVVLQERTEPSEELATDIKYDDPFTWPKEFSKANIETLFRGKVQTNAKMYPELTQFMHQQGRHEELLDEIRSITIKTPTEPVKKLDSDHIKYDDPATWPKEFSEADIEKLLDGKIHGNAAVNYTHLVLLHRERMKHELLDAIQKNHYQATN